MKLPLKQVKTHKFFKPLQWQSASPFIENDKAVLTHRPQSICTHIGEKGKSRSHISVRLWCNNVFSGTKKFTFTDKPMKLLCARCESAAVAGGMPSADSIVGEHVHLGGLRSVQLCCNKENNEHI